MFRVDGTMLRSFCNTRECKLKNIDPNYITDKNERTDLHRENYLYRMRKTFPELNQHLHFCLSRSYARPICIFTSVLWLSIKHATWRRVLLRVKATPRLCTCAHQSALLLGEFWNEPTSLHFLNHKLGASRDILTPLGPLETTTLMPLILEVEHLHFSPQLLLINCQNFYATHCCHPRKKLNRAHNNVVVSHYNALVLRYYDFVQNGHVTTLNDHVILLNCHVSMWKWSRKNVKCSRHNVKLSRCFGKCHMNVIVSLFFLSIFFF